MKKYLFLLLAAAACAACDDDVTREPSPVTPENCQNVYFSVDNFTSATVSHAETEFTLTVARAVSAEAAEVPVKISTIAPECFVFPESISFAAGETEAECVIGMTEKMELFEKYTLTLEIAPEYADYYTPNNDGSARWNISVMKTDFEPYAKCMFTCALFKNPLEQEMAYSKILDQYRLTNVWGDGLHFDFAWDGGDTFHPIGTVRQDGSIQVYIGPYKEESDMYFFCPANCSYDAETQIFEMNPDLYITGHGNKGPRKTLFKIMEVY